MPPTLQPTQPANNATADQPLAPLLHDLSHLMRREFQRRMEAAGVGLTRAQWQLLYEVARNPGASQTDVAEALELERMTVSRHAVKLAAEGWLERRPDEKDGRVHRLYLRKKAEQTLSELQPLVEKFRSDYFQGIPRQRRAGLFQELLTIRQNLVRRAGDRTHSNFS